MKLQKNESRKYNCGMKIIKDLPLAVVISNKEAYSTFKKIKR